MSGASVRIFREISCAGADKGVEIGKERYSGDIEAPLLLFVEGADEPIEFRMASDDVKSFLFEVRRTRSQINWYSLNLLLIQRSV